MSSTEQQPWPWRMLVSGVFEDAWMTAVGDERQQAYVKLIGLHREWQARGARLICTMDDLGSAGRPGTERANFYEVWEIPSPDIVHDLLEDVWSNKNGMPLTAHFSVRVSIGKPIVSMERDLGGPQLATTAQIEGEMPPIPLAS
ncbi:MAG TPA: hypothetical protein VLK36_06440 [Gaiellaceae bacterium]|nr:hypothetical protein [Gaiellaceae bacterium]